MRRLLLCVVFCAPAAAACCCTLLAQNVVTVASCPGAPSPQIPIQVDCSHVSDASAKTLCRPFAENQACKVFPAYRKITSIHLEDNCPALKYTLWDKDKWPYSNTGDGGFAGRCEAQLLTDFSLMNTSQIGPIDVHEILHVYQNYIGAIPYQHILFGPSMTEARRMMGDNKGYAAEFIRMKQEFNQSKVNFAEGKTTGNNPCLQAELYEETLLYMKDQNNAEQFYLKLQVGWAKDMADRQARFNRMYNEVSGGEAKPFLLAHGCGPF